MVPWLPSGGRVFFFCLDLLLVSIKSEGNRSYAIILLYNSAGYLSFSIILHHHVISACKVAILRVRWLGVLEDREVSNVN